MLFGNDDGTLWQNVILTYVFTPKLFLSTKPVKTKSFQKSNSIICEFQFFCLSLHAGTKDKENNDIVNVDTPWRDD